MPEAKEWTATASRGSAEEFIASVGNERQEMSLRISETNITDPSLLDFGLPPDL